MVSIGNFRNQQLYLGANRNLSTAKATLQVNTGAAKFRPSGKTTFIKIDKLDYQPAQSKNDDYIPQVPMPSLKKGDEIDPKDVIDTSKLNEPIDWSSMGDDDVAHMAEIKKKMEEEGIIVPPPRIFQ